MADRMTPYLPRQAMLLLLIAGFAIWGSAFMALYGVLSVGCLLGWEQIGLGPASLQRFVLLLIWIVHIVAIGLLLWWTARRLTAQHIDEPNPANFLIWAGWGSMVSALGATIWTGLPILLASSCL
jgi:hypothetical protein